MIILIIVILAEHHSHLLGVIEALSLFQVSHIILKLFHSLLDLSVVEMILDCAHHISHAVQFTDDQINLFLARAYHELDRPVLTRRVFFFE